MHVVSRSRAVNSEVTHLEERLELEATECVRCTDIILLHDLRVKLRA